MAKKLRKVRTPKSYKKRGSKLKSRQAKQRKR